MRIRRHAISGLVIAIFLVAAAPAAASSIVYIKDYNVWIADADGGNPHQVTLDGTSDSRNAYVGPTEADDGTIFANQGGVVVHLKQNGDVLNLWNSGVYALDEAVSPDGSKLAYNWDQIASCSGCGVGGVRSAEIATTANGTDLNPSQPDNPPDHPKAASWIGNGAIAIASDNYDEMRYQAVGSPRVDWFDPYAAFNPFGAAAHYTDYPAVTRDGQYMAIVLRMHGGNPTADDVVEILKLNGTDPTNGGVPPTPTPLCGLTASDTGGFNNLSWGDDNTLYYADSLGAEAVSIDYANDCKPNGPGNYPNLTVPSGAALIASATQPAFGQAANNPGPRTPAPGSGSTGTSGGSGSSGTGSSGTGGTGGTGGSNTTPTKLAGALVAGKSAKLKDVLKKGFAAKLSCNATCSYGVAIDAKNAVARKLGLTKSKKGDVVLGQVKGTAAAGSKSVTVKLGRKAIKALKHLKHGKSVGLVLELAVKDSAGHTTTTDYKLTIKA